MRPIVICLSIGLVALIAAEPEKPKNPAIGNPQAIEAGQKLFAGGCAGCHGPSGEGGRGPKLRNRAAAVWHVVDDESIFKVIKKGVPGADMPASNLEDDKLWQLVAFVRSINAPAIEQNVPGDVAAGEKVFWTKGGCSNCHLIRGKGGLLGPDLSNIGALQPAEQIRESILAPDIDGLEAYRRVTAVARDGKTVAGVLRNRSNYSLQIQDAKGGLHLLSTAGLKEITLEKSSPMPKDFKTRLAADELRDLVAYLSRQSMRSAEDRKSSLDEEKK